MKVSPEEPFQIVYSLYKHQFLGYLFESFIVALDVDGQLTFQHQNISSANAHEFAKGLEETDFKLIMLIDELQQKEILRKFSNKKQKEKQSAARHAVERQAVTSEFFLSTYNKDNPKSAPVRDAIKQYINVRMSKVLALLKDKQVFEMANDGEPTHKKIEVENEAASVLFHIMRNEDGTHYFPTLQHKEEKLEFRYKNGAILCDEPAWLLVEGKLYHFKQHISGSKLKPFLNKKFVAIPKKLEETYYQKFVASLVENYYIHAKGFKIKTIKEEPIPVISISDTPSSQALTLFGDNNKDSNGSGEDRMNIKLKINYGEFCFDFNKDSHAFVKFINKEGVFSFDKIKRKPYLESQMHQKLINLGLPLQNESCIISKGKAFTWLNDNLDALKNEGFKIEQAKTENNAGYFIGECSINFEITEGRDWFDIKAIVKFGNYQIPFLKLKKAILAGKKEFTLPGGEIAVIPEAWLTQYEELFQFTEESQEKLHLKKHHLAIVMELRSGNLAKVTLNRKLEKLKNDFSCVEEFPLSSGFKGKLRPYQHAGYNWLRFLADYKFGGCLADDMGLGKTIQTLAMLQQQKEEKAPNASLLVMPTSLLYNWEIEAKKFTPKLKIFLYTGTYRDKSVEKFSNYDLILTSYGIARLDIQILEKYYFNYVILDESQVIKNPSSNIAQAVLQLKSKNRLILTGTPVENSTLDLWSQMNFINPNLLGTQSYFKKNFLIPIEKKNDALKKEKLHAIIKPFVMRRHKSQVATELPEKVETVQYCNMTPEQEKEYEQIKSAYRNKILKHIEKNGIGKSQIVLLQGLTMLRQLANHPKMIDENHHAESGKLNDVKHMLGTVISKGHKILVFSQFVKHLQLVKETLIEQNIPFSYLDGSTKNRQQQVENFQNDKSKKVFLISLKAGGVGLNLTAADYVFILDPWWNPAAESQAIDRAHRIGQKNKVMIYKFITKNTVEEKILALQKSKLQLANDLITTEESFMKTLSKEDIHKLLD